MDAQTLVQAICGRGASIRAEGERLKVRNDELLSDEMRCELKRLKPALLKLLSEAPAVVEDERQAPAFDAGAAYCPHLAALHAVTIDDQTEGQGVRARLLEYAARRESEVNC